MKFKCSNCGHVFDGKPERCPKCNSLLNYPELKEAPAPQEEPVKEPEVVEEQPKVQEQPMPVQEPKEKKKRNIVLIIILILIILALIGLLIWALLRKGTSQETPSEPEVVTVYDLQLLKDLNKILASDAQVKGKHKTMYDALNAVKAKGFNVPQINDANVDDEILWDSVNDVFCYIANGEVKYLPDYPKAMDVNEDQLWTTLNVASDSDLSEKYATYLTSYTGTGFITIKNSIDVGDTDNVAKITYTNNTDVERNILIRTNNGNTDILVAAPTDVVHHYGKVGLVELVSVAPSSYHEFGTTKVIKIEEGRIKLEAGSKVLGVYFSAVDEDLNGVGERFKPITIQITEEAEMPTFYRDAVVIDEEVGTKVCTVEDENSSQDIYLFLQGIYEQVQVRDNENQDWIDKVETTTSDTKKVAVDICNAFQGEDVSAVIDPDTRVITPEEGKEISDYVEEVGSVPMEEVVEQVEFKEYVSAYVSDLSVLELPGFDLWFNTQCKDFAFLDVAYSFKAYEEADQADVDAFLAATYANGNPVFTNHIEDYLDQDKIDYALNVLARDRGQEAANHVKALLESRAKYLSWNADFEVSFDGDIEAGSVALAGYYGSFAEQFNDNKWLGFGVSNIGENRDDVQNVKAGDKIRLLATMDKVYHNPDFYMSYAAICGYVKEFCCGVTNLSDANVGKTVTVELYIYETDEAGNETGNKLLCGTYTYQLTAVQERNK